MSVAVRKTEIKVRKLYFGMEMSALANFTDGELGETKVCFPPMVVVNSRDLYVCFCHKEAHVLF